MRDRGDVAGFLAEDGSADLDRAEAKFRHAERLLESPLLAPLRVTPVAGRQIQSAHAISRAAADSLDAGVDLLGQLRQAIGSGVPAGAARIAALDTVGNAAQKTADRLRRVDLGPTEGLIGPLVDARNEASTNLGKALDLVNDASLLSSSLSTLLRGPSQYVLVAANSAEMRAGSGMFLEIGGLSFDGGSFTLGDMTSVTDLPVPAGAVPVTGDLADRWSFLLPTEEWRNLNASPRFDLVGSYAVQMWQAATGTPAQGLIALDPYALQAILKASGPVTIEGGQQVNASNVIKYILHDQYEGLSDDPGSVLRREKLRQIASAAVDALATTSLDPVSFVRSMIKVVHGRHLLIWSQDATMQEAWARVGVAGTLYDDSLAVSVLNRGANKLDQYLSVDANLSVAEPVDGRRQAELRLTLTNSTPPDEPRYIAGPAPNFTEYGQYIGIVAVNLPGWARNGRIDDLSVPLTVGADGPTRVVAGRYSVPMGGTLTVTVRFDLPADRSTIHIEPSGRPTPMTWTAGGLHFSDDQGHSVPIG